MLLTPTPVLDFFNVLLAVLSQSFASIIVIPLYTLDFMFDLERSL
ncbi:hypothetical protein [Anabaena sp. CCY 9402-a]